MTFRTSRKMLDFHTSRKYHDFPHFAQNHPSQHLFRVQLCSQEQRTRSNNFWDRFPRHPKFKTAVSSAELRTPRIPQTPKTWGSFHTEGGGLGANRPVARTGPVSTERIKIVFRRPATPGRGAAILAAAQRACSALTPRDKARSAGDFQRSEDKARSAGDCKRFSED